MAGITQAHDGALTILCALIEQCGGSLLRTSKDHMVVAHNHGEPPDPEKTGQVLTKLYRALHDELLK